ncbi:putative acid phosphatase homologues [Lyophyllum shimeji]|uniref:Acid phosphatase homologues n=1 Tax=Lyophyllum shimeji TaxID=47721 RepID=A0A9P3PPT3_LYOSH|nr:putative acid phosphatase homologues [Lyophyllum shimeji]
MAHILSEVARQKLQEPRGRPASSHFTLSAPGSENSSRDSSPAPSLKNEGLSSSLRYENAINLDVEKPSGVPTSPGRRPMDVYEATLPPWRAAVRRRLVKTVQRESKAIARLQDIIRTPWLDAYFVYTSSLGTHTFFMIILPAFFFFGHNEMGRELLVILALGVYSSSFMKDLMCSPRPFAPPVTRLTIGTHHLEYGFPSTHSTNCVSIALFFFAHAHRLASTPATPSGTVLIATNNNSTADSTLPLDAASSLAEPIISAQAFTNIAIVLAIYTFSIVFGRIYTAMHSFTDCAVGVALGAGIWWAQSSWTGIPIVLTPSNPLHWLCSFLWPKTLTDAGTYVMYLGKGARASEWMEEWVRQGGWEVPLILIPLCLLAVNQHPQPVDDCPCFEDAIAFGSVVLGALVGSWAMSFSGLRMDIGKTVVMPGSGWAFEAGQWMQVERTLWDLVVWWSFAALKMIVGVLVIFVWRLLAKSALHLILPPTFRGLARVFQLPNRRFYTPATDYKNVPSDFSGNGLQAIPSVIDLPSSGGVGIEVGGIGSGVGGVSVFGRHAMKLRGASSSSDANEKGGTALVNGAVQDLGDKDKNGEPVKHYDADVLTKVVVYAGIAVLSCEVLPAMYIFVPAFILALRHNVEWKRGTTLKRGRAPWATAVLIASRSHLVGLRS